MRFLTIFNAPELLFQVPSMFLYTFIGLPTSEKTMHFRYLLVISLLVGFIVQCGTDQKSSHSETLRQKTEVKPSSKSQISVSINAKNGHKLTPEQEKMRNNILKAFVLGVGSVVGFFTLGPMVTKALRTPFGKSSEKLEMPSDFQFLRAVDDVANDNSKFNFHALNRFKSDGLDKQIKMVETNYFKFRPGFTMELNGKPISRSYQAYYLPYFKYDVVDPKNKFIGAVVGRPAENFSKGSHEIKKFDILDADGKPVAGLFQQTTMNDAGMPGLKIDVHDLSDVNKKIITMELPVSLEGKFDKWQIKVVDKNQKEKIDLRIIAHYMAYISDNNWGRRSTRQAVSAP